MIISTCGYGTTGASAVADFIKGYSSIQIYDKSEFQLLHQPDGICDLKYHLTKKCDRISCNAAIKRFIRLKNNSWGIMLQRQCNSYATMTDEYINRLVVCSWNGKSYGDPSDVTNLSNIRLLRYFQLGINRFLRKRNRNWHYPRYQKRYYSALSENAFDEITQNYLHDIFTALGFDFERDIMIDMLFSATNPEMGMEFFDDAHAIIVDRDPRDLFLAARRNVWANAYMPWDSVESFCAYYRTIRDTAKSANNVLRIQYEDLIYHYYETTEIIMHFLGRSTRPDKEFEFFNPDKSVKFTNRKVDQVEYKEQIEYIEKTLPQYLYSFEAYIPVEEQKKRYMEKRDNGV